MMAVQQSGVIDTLMAGVDQPTIASSDFVRITVEER